jgi:hypothetical protein
MKFASLNPNQLNKLQELESQVGATVVAYEPVAVVAELSDEDLQVLKAMEAESGLVLLAVLSD